MEAETRAVTQLTPMPLMHYEIVFSDADMFVAINGPWKPSDFETFSVDANGCFILQGVANEVATLPIPLERRDAVRRLQRLWFMKIGRGGMEDMKELPHVLRVH